MKIPVLIWHRTVVGAFLTKRYKIIFPYSFCTLMRRHFGTVYLKKTVWENYYTYQETKSNHPGINW